MSGNYLDPSWNNFWPSAKHARAPLGKPEPRAPVTGASLRTHRQRDQGDQPVSKPANAVPPPQRRNFTPSETHVKSGPSHVEPRPPPMPPPLAKNYMKQRRIEQAAIADPNFAAPMPDDEGAAAKQEEMSKALEALSEKGQVHAQEQIARRRGRPPTKALTEAKA